MRVLMRLVLVIAFVLSACGGSAESTTTTEASAATTEPAGGEATTTEAPVTTTTTAPTSTTSTTSTTMPPATGGDAMERVEAKTAAVEAATPEGWTATTGPQEEFEEGQDFIYDACLEEGEFDIDNLDDVSEAVLLTTVEGPQVSNTFFPPPSVSIEARVIESEATAEQVFAVFERLYGSEEGIQCLTAVVTEAMGEDVPLDEVTFETEQVLVEGSQAGARFNMLFDVEGFEGGIYIEFQGARIGDCTVVGTFFAFGEPVDRDIADALFSAAVNA